MAKKTKRKINKKGILVILLTLYLIIMAFYYCFTLPIKNIIIKGNDLVSDEEIIKLSGLDNSTKIFSLNRKKTIEKIESLSLLNDVSVKKRINGTIIIEVKELKVLFYNVLNGTYVLENQSEVSDIDNLMGVPTLVNYVPSDIYESLINKMKDIDLGIISLISEIEYSKDVKDDIVIDNNRFLLRMNDGNIVYINLANFDNLSKYKKIYAALEENQKGVLNLDSSSNKVLFKTFEAMNADGGEQIELPE